MPCGVEREIPADRTGGETRFELYAVSEPERTAYQVIVFTAVDHVLQEW